MHWTLLTLLQGLSKGSFWTFGPSLPLVKGLCLLDCRGAGPLPMRMRQWPSDELQTFVTWEGSERRCQHGSSLDFSSLVPVLVHAQCCIGRVQRHGDLFGVGGVDQSKLSMCHVVITWERSKKKTDRKRRPQHGSFLDFSSPFPVFIHAQHKVKGSQLH